ncbi:T9SS type A sorting domain-containing protein [Dinghuibacter silviterrae]|uniref:Putative secreted protein (Por secretion system target) n=1 Tax=Dinghuibacter silviterrae TaxID=1539049 RepID=A0A4R8DMY9_9BACT|nr:T9SS type A sorting domain-containing protein [Dinghuibacter silviterrae]TDW99371.1 putative secreted protein (Por secretion system target) [Dinghuibacter silviterrae]
MKAYPLVLSLLLPYTLRAQSPVTAIFTHAINAGTATSYTGRGASGNSPSGFTGDFYTYHFGTNVATTNNNDVLDSFTVAGSHYKYLTAPLSVVFRRVNNANVTGLRKSLWFYANGAAAINNGGTFALYPDYDDSLERVFTERFFDVGIDNVFQNANTTNNNNIERMDVIFPGGVSATDVTKAGFVVFDRGSDPTHDPFWIAAIKTLDGSGNPSAYYNAVKGESFEYGVDVGSSINYVILRRNYVPTADGHLLMMDNTTAQNRDGVFFTFSNLGVPANTLIYGYSLMDTTVVASPATNIVDYTNGTNFPTTTDLPLGGLDPVAVTGLWVTSPTYIILPERIETFDARASNSDVTLNWNLGITDDVGELVVERSADGKAYVALSSISSPDAGPQVWVDKHPLTGSNYYRLLLLDKNGGSMAYSSVSTVDLPVTPGIKIYPNPVENRQFTLSSSGLADGAYFLRLFDGNGRPVFTQTLNEAPGTGKTINLPRILAAGMYYLQVLDSKNNKILVKPLLID